MSVPALRRRLRYPVWLLLLLLVTTPLLSVAFLVKQREDEASAAIAASKQAQLSFSHATQLEQLSLWLTVADVTERLIAGLAEAGLPTEVVDSFLPASDEPAPRSVASMLLVPRQEVISRAAALIDGTESSSALGGSYRRQLATEAEDFTKFFAALDRGEVSNEQVVERLRRVRRLSDAAAGEAMRRVLRTESVQQAAFVDDMLAMQSTLRGHRALVQEIEVVSAIMTGEALLAQPDDAIEQALRAHGVFEHEREVFQALTGVTSAEAAWNFFEEQERNRLYSELRDEVPAYLASSASGERSDFPAVDYLFLSFERMVRLVDVFIPEQLEATFASIDAATAETTAAANATRRFAAGVVGTTLLLAFVIAQLLLHPLRKLWRRAIALTSGEGSFEPLGPIGPREVAAVAQAIDGVSSNLDIIGGQLDAISQGDFGAAVLRSRLPGAVGRSLEHSMNEASKSSALMHEQARVDVLTGLPNRLEAIERLDEVLRDGEIGTKVGVAFLDLDRFKMINDGLGHEAGDAVLVQLAERFTEAMQPNEFVGRIGGDEFLAVRNDIEDIAEIREMVDRLLDAAEEPFSVAGRELRLKSSAGIAVAESGRSTSSQLLHDADLGLYASKNTTQRVIASSPDLRRAGIVRREITEAIERAIGTPDFQVHLQPIVDLATGQTVAAEALLRWTRDGASVSPADFIPIIEATSLINTVGRWVLMEAARHAADLVKKTGRSIPISVNISWNHLVFGNLVDDVWAALKATDLPPTLLSLEFTESTPPPDIDMVGATLSELNRLGVKVWLDDFGTGYTSITQLRELAFDIVKLDRAFVVDAAMSNDGITDALMGIMGALGVDVVAEGVETMSDRDRMIAAGATFGQGWLWSPSLPIEEFVAYIERESRSDDAKRRSETERRSLTTKANSTVA